MGSKIVKNLQSTLRKTQQAITAEIVDLADDVEQTQRAQMKQGKKGDGSPMTPRYTENYLTFKSRTVPEYALGGTPDLFFTGKFYKSIEAIPKGFKYEIKSNDSEKYFGIVLSKYQPLGLSKNNETGLASEYLKGLAIRLRPLWK